MTNLVVESRILNLKTKHFLLNPPHLDELTAHSSNCICLSYDPTGKYFAIGSNDVLVSLWDAKEYKPIRTFSELSWPVRTLSFSHDARLLAAASEDHFIDISLVEPLPGQMMWESFGGSSSQSQNSGQNYSNYVNGRYRDRFTLGESQHGEEYLIHSNKYLANRKSSSSVYKIETGLPTFSVAWHPSRPILAYWFWGFGSVFFSKNNSFLICFSLNKNSNQNPLPRLRRIRQRRLP